MLNIGTIGLVVPIRSRECLELVSVVVDTLDMLQDSNGYIIGVNITC